MTCPAARTGAASFPIRSTPACNHAPSSPRSTDREGRRRLGCPANGASTAEAPIPTRPSLVESSVYTRHSHFARCVSVSTTLASYSTPTMTSTPSLQDPGLAERIRKQEPDALAAVVEEYLDHILRAARGSGLDEHQAEELAQNTFTTFIETAPRFEGRSRVRTWIFGIFYRKLQEARRGFAKDRKTDDIDEVFEDRFDRAGDWARPPRGPEAAFLSKESLHEIDRCLETVPDRQRLAFILREVEGLSTQEICKTLGVSSTNFGVMMFRVRNRLRNCLESKWEQA